MVICHLYHLSLLLILILLLSFTLSLNRRLFNLSNLVLLLLQLLLFFVFILNINDTSDRKDESQHTDYVTLHGVLPGAIQAHVDEHRVMLHVNDATGLHQFNGDSLLAHHLKVGVVDVKLNDDGQS